MPDFFKGDSLPLDAVEGVEAAKGVLSKIPAVTRMLTIAGPWLYRHREGEWSRGFESPCADPSQVAECLGYSFLEVPSSLFIAP